MTLQLIVFIVLALFIAVCSVLEQSRPHVSCVQQLICCSFYLVQQVFTSNSTTHSWELYNY